MRLSVFRCHLANLGSEVMPVGIRPKLVEIYFVVIYGMNLNLPIQARIDWLPVG